MPIYKTGKQKDGKAQYLVTVNYTDASGNYKKKRQRCYGAQEAKLLEMQLTHELSEGAPLKNLTVGQLYEEYMSAKRHEVRASSYEKTASIIGHNILPELAGIKLDKLTISRLQKWKTNLAEQSTKVSTKNNAYKEFNAMLNYAVRMEYIPKNPLKAVGNFKEAYFETVQDKLHYYTPDQFFKYIACAEADRKTFIDHGCCVFFYIAFYTGMRKGEINALRWSDIQGDRIYVRRSISQKTKSGVKETPPKNKSSYRDLQMPAKLLKILRDHKELQKKMQGFSESFYICGGPSYLSDTNIDLHNRRYADAAGLPHIKVHDFRHSHASLLCNEGINVQEIARRLGHSDISMTWNTYSHLYPREEERAVKILDSLNQNGF